jgi:hypothetical protein
MEDTIAISYCYTFGNDESKEFTITLDRKTLALIPRATGAPPSWTALDHNRCDICTIDANAIPNCPIAVNLAGIVAEFREFFSYETVAVTVTTEERTYLKTTDIQIGLSALIGIIMVTSGCPVMERLKPMVRFHLPFATIQETLYRMVSTYLVAQFFLQRKGKAFSPAIDEVEKIYADVAEVNRNFAMRLRNEADRDANINALVNLDCFAAMAPIMIEDLLEEIEPYFSAYF